MLIGRDSRSEAIGSLNHWKGFSESFRNTKATLILLAASTSELESLILEVDEGAILNIWMPPCLVRERPETHGQLGIPSFLGVAPKRGPKRSYRWAANSNVWIWRTHAHTHTSCGSLGSPFLIRQIFVWVSCFWFCIPPAPQTPPPRPLCHTQSFSHTIFVTHKL